MFQLTQDNYESPHIKMEKNNKPAGINLFLQLPTASFDMSVMMCHSSCIAYVPAHSG